MWATNFIEWFNKWTVIRQGTVTNTTACDFVVVWLFPIYESPERWRQQVRAGNSQSQMRSAFSRIRLVDLTMTLAKDYYLRLSCCVVVQAKVTSGVFMKYTFSISTISVYMVMRPTEQMVFQDVKKTLAIFQAVYCCDCLLLIRVPFTISDCWI